jgi:hypothetical protein
MQFVAKLLTTNQFSLLSAAAAAAAFFLRARFSFAAVAF